MKHHIALKFIAVLLCAASLLGALASAAGILALTEGDLFNKTVDQVKEERLRDFGADLANRLASAYASKTLGGCPEEMVRDHYLRWGSNVLKDSGYGYLLMDERGNTLDIYNQDILEDPGALSMTFPAQGSYHKLYDVLTQEQMQPQQTQPTQAGILRNLLTETVTAIEDYSVSFADGTNYGASYDQGTLGEAWMLDGQVHCRLEMNGDLPMGMMLTHIVLRDDTGKLVYEAKDEEGVGSFQAALEDGIPVMTYQYPGETPEDPYIYDAVSPQGQEVYGLNYTVDDSSSAGVSSDAPIGRLSYKNGHLWFKGYLPNMVDDRETNGTITHIRFEAIGEQLLYEARSSEGVGNFMFDGSNVPSFYCSIPTENAGSNGPQPARADVWQVEIFQDNGERLYAVESQDAALGQFWYDDDGYANLTFGFENLSSWSESGELSQGRISDILVRDSLGNILFSGEDGFVFAEDGSYVYQSAAPVDTLSAKSGPEPAAQAETLPVTTEAAEETVPETTAVAETLPETAETTVPPAWETVPSSASAPATTGVTEPPETSRTEPENLRTWSYYDSELGQTMYVRYEGLPLPGYTLKLVVLPDAYTYGPAYEVLEVLRAYRSDLFLALGVSLLLFAIFTVYLCCAAGRKPGSPEVRAGGLNLLPLDLYTGILVGCICSIGILGVEGTEHFFRQKMEVAIVYAGAAAYAVCLLIVGFCFAFVAQIKTPRRFWLRNTLIARFLALWVRLAVRLEAWLSQKGGPGLVSGSKKLWAFSGKLMKNLWGMGVKATLWCLNMWKKFWSWFGGICKKTFSWLGRSIHRFLTMLPLTWQWVLEGTALILIGSLTFANRRDGWGFLWFLVGLGLTLYIAHCFGNLWESTRKMSKGDLDTKVDDKMLLGCFKDFAVDLNDLADVAVVAAQKQLKSERMKTELITNVSHDIKTPLTSIINYVDLLQKPHTGEQQEQYLEVLSRQSLRLKKLIDDLMEMSKASTGNMAVDITRLDAVESVNQALGEFSDKLERAQLSLVFRHADDSAPMLADGRLVWRVMSNVLSNAVKYAMPGTRLYVDLMTLEGKVVISIKNISREELTVDADELMERFVRGDDSRNTEGSGLGLNIAKSLMELQKGQLQLLVDGDLFKVTLIFPGA